MSFPQHLDCPSPKLIHRPVISGGTKCGNAANNSIRLITKYPSWDIALLTAMLSRKTWIKRSSMLTKTSNHSVVLAATTVWTLANLFGLRGRVIDTRIEQFRKRIGFLNGFLRAKTLRMIIDSMFFPFAFPPIPARGSLRDSRLFPKARERRSVI